MHSEKLIPFLKKLKIGPISKIAFTNIIQISIKSYNYMAEIYKKEV